MDKKKVEDKLPRIDLAYQTVADVVSMLQGLIQKYQNAGYSNLRICEYGDYDEDYHYFYLTGERDETDAEFHKRLAAEERAHKASQMAKQKQLAHEKKQYERLKKKFEGNNKESK
jgi:hypothetical protein